MSHGVFVYDGLNGVTACCHVTGSDRVCCVTKCTHSQMVGLRL